MKAIFYAVLINIALPKKKNFLTFGLGVKKLLIFLFGSEKT